MESNITERVTVHGNSPSIIFLFYDQQMFPFLINFRGALITRGNNKIKPVRKAKIKIAIYTYFSFIALDLET